MNNKKKKNILPALAMAGPVSVWMILFVTIPMLYIIYISFMSRGVFGDVVYKFSTESYKTILNPTYFKVILKSLKAAGITTILCLLLGYPLAYIIAHKPKDTAAKLITLIMIPFWTNSLMRLNSWLLLFQTSGPINNFLVGTGIVKEPITFIYTDGLVLIGLITNMLPFAVLPLYSTIEKLDKSLIEASADLGASAATTFMRVTLPITFPGIFSAIILVFIPSLGIYTVTDMLGGGKISKSKANTTVNVIDPIILAERYGVDALRYYLLREFPFGSDGNFSNESLIKRINIDLANDLGNLVSRTTAMAVKYFGGTLPAEQQADEEKDAELIALASGLKAKYYEKMEAYTFQSALVDIFEVISRANKYIDENAPWVLAKNDEDKPRLARVLYNLLEAVRICTIMLTPFMPDTTAKIFEQIGAEKTGWEDAGIWGLLPADVTVHKGENLFPRIDLDKELETLKEIELARQAEQAGSTVEFKDEIDFETFEKVDMTVCKVKSCENVKKSKKLLKFILDDGSGKDRQILSGIAAYYKPEDLVGKTVVAVTNLAPRKMMGQESCGMLLSAEKHDKLQLIILDDAIEAGAKFC